MKYIITNSGIPIIVDDFMFEELNVHQWRACQVGKGGKFYAYADIEGQNVLMHRMILGLKKGDELWGDHINGCSLDNRKSNLRKVNPTQNSWNLMNHKHNHTGLRGICYHKTSNKWQARIYKNNKRVSLGYFDTKEEASKVYSEAYNQLKVEIFKNAEY